MLGYKVPQTHKQITRTEEQVELCKKNLNANFNFNIRNKVKLLTYAIFL